jgi:hypothetical protein
VANDPGPCTKSSDGKLGLFVNFLGRVSSLGSNWVNTTLRYVRGNSPYQASDQKVFRGSRIRHVTAQMGLSVVKYRFLVPMRFLYPSRVILQRRYCLFLPDSSQLGQLSLCEAQTLLSGHAVENCRECGGNGSQHKERLNDSPSGYHNHGMLS